MLAAGTTWVVAQPTASGDRSGDDSAQADPREIALAEIRSEIRRLEGRLRKMSSRTSTLEDRLQRVSAELELQEIRLNEATAAVELADGRAAAAEAKISELQVTMDEIRSDLKRRLVGMYRLGRNGYLRLFLSIEPDQGLLPAIRQLRFLAHRDRLHLERYYAVRTELEAQGERLAVQRREAETWRQQEGERRDELLNLRRRQETLLSELEGERRRLEERTAALKDKQRKLGRLIASLAEGALSLEGTPIQEFRGALDWPLEGKVTAGFGPRRDPRYRTEVPHNGIDIEAPPATEVRAVFPGRVLYASHFEGYGTMVVVYHPGQVFSLYAGLQELQVEKDDVLSLGQVLGPTHGTLYFEIRLENLPEDPRLWLR